MSHFKKTACLLAAISLLLPLRSYEYQEVQDQTKIRKLAASQINIAAIVYRKNPCFPDDVDMNDFLPVEPGKNVYIWPDAKSTAIQFIHQLTKWEMEDGDTLYLRPGVYDDGVIYTVDFTKISAPRRRIHVRGSGVSNTTLEGWIWAGHGSTIKNLTVDNRGKYSDDTSIDIDSASVTIENVIVKGGRNGLLAGPGLFGESSGSVTLNCLRINNVTYNGIMLGGNFGEKINNCSLNNVSVDGTGNMGVEIIGDGAVINQLFLSRIGTDGLRIEGSNARIIDSNFYNVDLYAIGVDGPSPTISGITIQNIGTQHLGTGVILYENSTNYSVNDSAFSSVRIGILHQVNVGSFSNNSFSNIYYRDILYSSPDPQPSSPADKIEGGIKSKITTKVKALPKSRLKLKPASKMIKASSLQIAALKVPVNMDAEAKLILKLTKPDPHSVKISSKNKLLLKQISTELKKNNLEGAKKIWVDFLTANKYSYDTEDINTVILKVLRDTYQDTLDDLYNLADKVRYYNEAKKMVRDHLYYLRYRRDIQKKAGKMRIKTLKIKPKYVSGAPPVKVGAAKSFSPKQMKAEISKYENELDKLKESSEDMSLKLQDQMEKGSRMIRLLSSISKSMHDISYSIIRNMKE